MPLTGDIFPLSEINRILQESKLWIPHASLPYVGSVGGAVAGGLNSMYETHEQIGRAHV